MSNCKKSKTVVFDFSENGICKLYLTTCQKEFVKVMLIHFSIKKVARDMNITPSTARAYAIDVRLKMGMNNTIGASYKAQSLDLGS